MKGGWRSKRLGDVSVINYGYTEKASSDPIGPKFLRITDIQDDSVNWDTVPYCKIPADKLENFRLNHNDVVFARTGATTGKSFLVKKPPSSVFASYLIRLQLKSAEILPEFLILYFQTPDYWNTVQEGTAGSAQGGFNATKLAELVIPTPPIIEQKRIVSILDEAFDRIAMAKANAERNLKNTRALFEYQLDAVFQRNSDSWKIRRLGDIVTRLTNGFVGPTRNIYRESGIPYLLARHVKNNNLLFDGKTFISGEFNLKNKKSMLKEGDVLLVQSGHIGHSAVVTKEHEGHNCHAMIVITPVDGTFLGSFLSLFFNSSGMKQKFQEIRSGSTVPHLTCGEIKELEIPLPDIATQQRIVDHSREFREESLRLEVIYQRKISALDELKKSLLHCAFAGEL